MSGLAPLLYPAREDPHLRCTGLSAPGTYPYDGEVGPDLHHCYLAPSQRTRHSRGKGEVLTSSVSSICTPPVSRLRNGSDAGASGYKTRGSFVLGALGGGIPQLVPRGHEPLVLRSARDVPGDRSRSPRVALDMTASDVVVRGAMRRLHANFGAIRSGLHGRSTLHPGLPDWNTHQGYPELEYFGYSQGVSHQKGGYVEVICGQ